MRNIAIFASGSGTNFERIVQYAAQSEIYRVSVLYCNNPSAYALKRAEKLGIPSVLMDRRQFSEPGEFIRDMEYRGVEWIVLAGFLWLIPDEITRKYNNRIINIHPALLPKYGGKGMYGMKVHEAVIAAGERESGITVHFVNNRYDEGKILFQAKCAIDDEETAESLAGKIHQLEYEYYPKVIERLLEADV